MKNVKDGESGEDSTMTNRWCLFSILLLCLALVQPSMVRAAEPDSPADLARERIAAEFFR